MTTPAHTPLDEATLRRWLDEYGTAWETRDADAAARIFTPDATYLEKPDADAFLGREGIRNYWATVTADQRDVAFEAHIIAIDGDIGIAEWVATFTNAPSGAKIHLNGVFVLRFAGPLCRELREWWFVRSDPPMA